MISHGLLLCSFSFKRRYSKGEKADYFSLNEEFEHEGKHYNDVFELMDGFFSNCSTYNNDDKRMKMFAIDKESIFKKVDSSYTIVTGIIKSGAYGIESSITDIESQAVVYERKKTDADIKDFNFLMYVPRGRGYEKIIKGIFVFEMIGHYGVKTISVSNMRLFFAEKYGLTMETRRVSTSAFIESLLHNQKLNKITMIKNKVSYDPTDNMFVSVGREEKSYIKPKVTESWIKKLLSFLDGSNVNEIFEIEDESFEDVSLTFNHMGRCKTVKLSSIDKFSLIEDVPKYIYEGSDINRAKLLAYMEELAVHYAEKMVFVFEE